MWAIIFLSILTVNSNGAEIENIKLKEASKCVIKGTIEVDQDIKIDKLDTQPNLLKIYRIKILNKISGPGSCQYATKYADVVFPAGPTDSVEMHGCQAKIIKGVHTFFLDDSKAVLVPINCRNWMDL